MRATLQVSLALSGGERLTTRSFLEKMCVLHAPRVFGDGISPCFLFSLFVLLFL